MPGREILDGDNEELAAFFERFRRDVIEPFTADEGLRYSVDYCVTEIVLNAQEHGNRNDPAKKITVSWGLEGRGLRITVEDEGEGFVPRIPPGPPPFTQDRGRGLFSVVKYAGTLLVSGNKVTITFKEDTKMITKKAVQLLTLGTNGTLTEAERMNALEEMKNGLVDAVSDGAANPLIAVLDLSAFPKITSKFIGALGSAALAGNVLKICLCGVQEHVARTLAVLGVASGVEGSSVPCLKNNIVKVHFYNNVEEAVPALFG